MTRQILHAPRGSDGAAQQRDAADEGRLEPYGSAIFGTVIVYEGKVVRPSQLIASVGRTIRGATMTRLGTAIVLVAFSGCSDVREERFATLGEPAAQGMVARGWIPAGLPLTGTDVVVRSNIDTNMVRGRLRLPPGQPPLTGRTLRVVAADQTLPFYGRFTPEWWPKELNPPGRASQMQAEGWDLFIVEGERSTYVAVHRSKGELYFWGEGS